MKEQQTTLCIEPKQSQDWAKYNLAKTNEKRLFYELLRQLVKIIEEPKSKIGRPPIKLRDLIFCIGLKLYSNYSGRKAVSDYRVAQNAGFIERAPSFNSVKDFLNYPETYDLLKKLLTISAMPLRNLEDKYSLDSSGFGSYQFERWSKIKENPKKHKNYLKGHILIGTRTNIICNAEVTPGNFADIKQAPKLILECNENFNMKEISADKGYSSKLLYRIINSINSIPYIPFKKGTAEPEKKDIWGTMFYIFKKNQNLWYKHYHFRSNVETTFAMVKRRFGEILLSKNYVAQRNELMMKFICHNIACLIQEVFERKVIIDFKAYSEIYVERKVPEEYLDRDGSKVQNLDY